DIATYLRETADCWNENIERWIYAEGSDLAQEIGVDGYYVRIAPPETDGAASPLEGFVPIKNRPPGESLGSALHLISPDVLALVRITNLQRGGVRKQKNCCESWKNQPKAAV